MSEHKQTIKKISKKGQIGEGLTWVVAIFIIVVVMSIFVFAASSMGYLRSYSVSSSQASYEIGSMLNAKTELALSINNQNEGMIREWIKGGEK